MAAPPAQEPSGWDEDLSWLDRDPVTAEEREAWLDRLAEADEPPDPDEEDPEDGEPLTADELAEIRRFAESGGGPWAGVAGRRGPGQPGSARVYPGESCSPAAAFGSGLALDVMPACPGLALSADAAAGDDDSYAGVSDDELLGMLAAWDRLEAHMAARKLAAAAELIRRSPEQGCRRAEGPGRMPGAWDEFAADELASALAESRAAAEGLLELARDLAARLPGTAAALRDGIISRYKAQLIAAATALLDAAEAAAAEALVLGRAGRLTPGGLRAAIARAVMEVAPEKAQQRREDAAKNARVQRWAEDSGNAALMGRELPPAEVLAADQRITAWAQELRRAGLDGDMDVLRARAYLDLLLGKDSRPRHDTADRGGSGAGATGGASGQDGAGPSGRGRPGSRGPGSAGPGGPPPAGPGAGAVPAGFAGRVTLTVPLTTLTGLAARPGEIPGIGPVDPALARDLADAAARNTKTTWCVTVTDEHGHAIGHGCASSEPKSHRTRVGRGPPGGATFALTAASRDGPPGGYGTWTLQTPGGGSDLLVRLDSLDTGPCDHRFQASGHDPGVKLRHLTQIRHATCTAPICRRPASQCDFDHNVAYEAGGRTCLCNGGPKCRHDHRLKQDPRWKVDQLPDGTFRWTTSAGRTYTTEPTRYPI